MGSTVVNEKEGKLNCVLTQKIDTFCTYFFLQCLSILNCLWYFSCGTMTFTVKYVRKGKGKKIEFSVHCGEDIERDISWSKNNDRINTMWFRTGKEKNLLPRFYDLVQLKCEWHWDIIIEICFSVWTCCTNFKHNKQIFTIYAFFPLFLCQKSKLRKISVEIIFFWLPRQNWNRDKLHEK